MTSLKQMENMVREIPQHKIEKLLEYVKGKKPSILSITTIQEDLELTSSEAREIKKIFSQTDDGNILSISINSILQNQSSQDKIKTKLVMTGKFKRKGVDYTHETVYQMVNRAKFRITIIGYWVYDMQDFFKELSRLQEEKEGNLEIRFILDSGTKWKSRIMKNWNKKYLPELFEVDKKQVKTLHAKVIIIDDSEMLITSANLTINAMEENIEAGIWSNDKNLIEDCTKIFKNFGERKIIKEVPKKKY